MTEPRFFAEAAEEIEHERSFLRELDRAIAIVMEGPHRWPQHIGGTRRYVFPRFPFSLVYFVEDDVVVIVALEAEHKEPGYWTNRLR